MEKQSMMKPSLNSSGGNNTKAKMVDEVLARVAKEFLRIETLKHRGDAGADYFVSDENSFSVLALKEALQEAYEAGCASKDSTEDSYINCKANDFYNFAKHRCGFEPVMEPEIVSALESLVDDVYHDGFHDGYKDGQLPIGGQCNICGICAYDQKEKAGQ